MLPASTDTDSNADASKLNLKSAAATPFDGTFTKFTGTVTVSPTLPVTLPTCTVNPVGCDVTGVDVTGVDVTGVDVVGVDVDGCVPFGVVPAIKVPDE